ncbi:uncharacterized protein C17orf113-like [Ptychodera flava]|uniref:uncharacterized protein C17orf113-like n=1 Tax=Ptychodera flava TaxID=63121 RepID=UPI00396A24CB
MKRQRCLITSFFAREPSEISENAATVKTNVTNERTSSTSSEVLTADADHANCATTSTIASHQTDSATVTVDTDGSPTEAKKKKVDVWKDSWLATYSWLEKPQSDRGMFCKVCRRAGKVTPFSCDKGCTNYKTSTLMRHAASTKHQEALKEVTLRSGMKTVVSNALTKNQNAVLVAIKCVYWLAKEAVATDKYSSLLDLMDANGCELVKNLSVSGNTSYRSHTTAEELQQACADAIKANIIIVRNIRNSDFFSLLTDESTDISVSGRLVLYIRSVTDEFDVRSNFVGNLHLVEKDSSAITDKLCETLKQNGFETTRMVGLGSDGASVMVGHKNGVSAKLKGLNPFLLNVHCIAHRLALCTSQAAATVDYLKEYKNILTSLFYYFKASSLRSSRLREVEIMLESPQLKVKEIHEVRWFAFYDALQTVFRSWNALVTFFDAQSKSKDAKAVGLHDKLTQYKFIAVTYIMMDIIPIVTRLNLIFQKDDIDIAAVKPCVSTTIEQLQQYKEGNIKGFYATKLEEEIRMSGQNQPTLMGHSLKNREKQIALVNRVKDGFIDNLINNINVRFPADSTGVISAFDVLAMRDLSFIPPDRLSEHGNDKLEILIAHYGVNKVTGEGQVCKEKTSPDDDVIQASSNRDNV